MGIFTWAAAKVVGSSLGKVFSVFGDYRNQKSVIEAGILTEVIQSDIEINRMKLTARALDATRWETRWIMPAFAYPVAFHFGAVILDSVFHLGWKISALPGPMAEWEGQIVLSFFIVGTTQSLVQHWLNRGLVQSVITNAKSVFKGRRK